MADLPLERYLSVKAVAACLGLHPETVAKLARSGKLAGIKYGRRWHFRGSDVARWVERQAPPPPAS